MARAVGIDLGTTNSVIATMEGREPTVIVNSEGARTTPSVVAFTDSGERLVGQLARRQAILNPKGTIYSAKRFVGRQYAEVTEEAKAVTFDVVEGPDGTVRFEVRGKQYAPEEISAQVLRKLVDDAGRNLGEKITQAVITVPAYFNDAQRTATRDAGRIAGLEVLRIINEPTAAALAYGLDKKGHETVLVFDLGGGTFDVSVLDVGDGVVEVRATAGDSHLGGDDFDRRLVDHLADGFHREQSIDLRNDPQALQRLFEAAEKAKTELSSVTQTQVSLPFVTADASGPKHLTATVTRATFDELTADLVQRCLEPVQQAMADAKVVRRRPGRGDPGRRVDPHPGRAGVGAPADRRQGTEHDGQPGRGGRAGGRGPGGRAHRRGPRGAAARRHAAVAGSGDAGRGDDEGHRAQHHDPGPPDRGVLHRGGQPAGGRHRGAAGRAGAGRRQPGTGPVPAGEHPSGAARRAADRGHLRRRRQRHPQRVGQGQGHRCRAGHHDQRHRQPRSSEVDRMVADAQSHRDEDARLRTMVDARNELEASTYQIVRRLDELGDAAPAHERARAEMLVADARQAIKEEAPLDRVRELTGEVQQVYQGLMAAGVPRRVARLVARRRAASRPGRRRDDVIDADFTPQ